MSGWSAAPTSARPPWLSSRPPTRPRPERSSRSRKGAPTALVVTPTCATRPAPGPALAGDNRVTAPKGGRAPPSCWMEVITPAASPASAAALPCSAVPCRAGRAKLEAQGDRQHRRNQVQGVGVVRGHLAEQQQSRGGERERDAGGWPVPVAGDQRGRRPERGPHHRAERREGGHPP